MGQHFTNKPPQRGSHDYCLLTSSRLSLRVLTLFLCCTSKTCMQGKCRPADNSRTPLQVLHNFTSFYIMMLKSSTNSYPDIDWVTPTHDPVQNMSISRCMGDILSSAEHSWKQSQIRFSVDTVIPEVELGHLNPSISCFLCLHRDS